jgi:hypothetical protein
LLRLRAYGERLILFSVQTVGGRPMLIRALFMVSDVRRPLLAVIALMDQGFSVNFGRTAAVVEMDTGAEVALETRGNGYFFPATLQMETSGHLRG